MAHFRIAMAEVSTPHIFTNIRDEGHRLAAIIASIALSAYVGDVKMLVSKGVTKNIDNIGAQGDHISLAEADSCRAGLKHWLKTSSPLSYDPEAYRCLIEALRPRKADHNKGLPMVKASAISVHTFASSLVRMSRTKCPDPVATPLLSTGTAPAVMKVAIAAMEPMAQLQTQYSAPDFIIQAFIKAMDYMKINYIPWTPDSNQQTGRPRTKPKFDSWISLGMSESSSTSTSKAAAPTESARQVAESNDCRALWSAESITLQELPRYLKRTIPPIEWNIKHAALGGDDKSITSTTYHYVFNQLDLTRPLHHLALLVSIILTKCLPTIHWNVDNLQTLTPGLSGNRVTEKIRGLSWTTKGKKGSKKQAPYLVLITAFIIAIYDPESPVRRNLARTKSWDAQFLSKHSNKSISAVQLIRIGLGKALKYMGKSPKLDIPGREGDWRLLDEDELLIYYQTLKDTFQKGQYGPYRVAIMVVGEMRASMLSKEDNQVIIDTNEIMTGVAHIGMGKSREKRRKRKHEDDDDDEDDDDEEIIRPTQRIRI